MNRPTNEISRTQALVPSGIGRSKGTAHPLKVGLLARTHYRPKSRDLRAAESYTPEQAIEYIWAGWTVIGKATYSTQASPYEDRANFGTFVLHHPDGGWAVTLMAVTNGSLAWKDWEARARLDWAQESLIHAFVAAPGTLDVLAEDFGRAVSALDPFKADEKWGMAEAILRCQALPGVAEEVEAMQMLLALGGFNNMQSSIENYRATQHRLRLQAQQVPRSS